MSKIDDLCARAGVRIVPRRKRRHGRETHARQTLTKLASECGPGHVLFVLRAIAENDRNKAALWSEIIWAVSDIVIMRPDLADRGLAFMEALDGIDLNELRLAAKAMRIGAARDVLRVMLAERLAKALLLRETATRLRASLRAAELPMAA
ncbi:hypothetical protein [Hansschlegelia plantiphila]|uniref:Uncharacterized protein n=1 Tax=Hansschlegelia plantiphila TaxID=374655 RepID=A0A9W6J1K9_9HYPH|nr:hypothetical protein [Hansschlegelia plantiphila]GLK68106.1 hypothetical protein GCM10008179_17440 [Hansschlegelia plantiphila]